VSLSVIPFLNALALIVVLELKETALEYAVDEEVGSEPSVVYLIVASDVLQLISTLCDDEYVPPEGLKVGVATLGGILMVYVAEAVSLSSIPVFEALALMVRLSLTGIGLAYSVDDDEGSVPSMV